MISSALVSIIIPVYNVEIYIQNSLESALKQTYNNIEYIIVDDCGSDKSINIVESMIQLYPDKRIRLIRHKTNQGLSEARNTGLRAAEGDYVFFMDSDDELSNNSIELHLDAIINSNADFSDGNVRMVGVYHNNFFTYASEHTYINDQVLPEYFHSLHICGWNKLIRREFLIDNKIFFRKGMLYEDMLWTYQVCKKAKKYVTVPHETYYYLIRQGSITTQNKNVNHAYKQFNSFIELMHCMKDEFMDPSNDELVNLQSKWFNKTLLIVKTRLLDAPFDRNNREVFFKQMNCFTESCSGILKLIHRIPFSMFSFLFFIPNKIFRKIR